jgi:hypothetical protein
VSPEAATYEVTILNTENYFSAAGQRVFRVSAEGLAAVPDLDLFVAAGAKCKAFNSTFLVQVCLALQLGRGRGGSFV